MPYFVEPAFIPQPLAPNGQPTPQFNAFIQQLTANLNGIEARNLTLLHVIPTQSSNVVLLVFK